MVIYRVENNKFQWVKVWYSIISWDIYIFLINTFNKTITSIYIYIYIDNESQVRRTICNNMIVLNEKIFSFFACVNILILVKMN